jgi:hypothetical protein
LELFRLERLRLERNRHQHDLHYRSAGSPGRVAPIPRDSRTARPQTAGTSSFSKQRFLNPRIFGPPRPLAHLQNSFLAAQEDWRCYHSLPQKIQQSHFSEEERIVFQDCCTCCILDAADAAIYKLEQRGKPDFGRPGTSPSSTKISMASPTASSGYPPDSAIDMDDSFYDNFRWLDEEGGLDLSLAPNHSPTNNARHQSSDHVSPTSLSPLEKPSLETFSFTSAKHNQASTPTSAGLRLRNSSFSSNFQLPIAGHPHRSSTTRPFSAHTGPHHTANRSTSSIDLSAQYYQDPEARLKLRVYLASPQKFDEVVEFGFPSLENKENAQTLPPIHQLQQSTREFSNTFFQTGPQSVEPGNREDPNQLREKEIIARDSSLERRLQPLQALQTPCALGRPRQMTLKMTLTRPDLRTAEPTCSDHKNFDPLALEALPPADEDLQIWDSSLDEQNMVKRMWRKLRKRRD